jgi:hypothetical protein
MTEYVPDDHHHHDDAHDATPHVDLPDHQPDAVPSDAHLPPLDDLGSAHAPLPDELHFPGDDAAHDAHASADLDPAAPWPDDQSFSDWLGDPQHAGGDDGSDTELRDQLAPPAEEPGGLPSSDALVEGALRRLEDS